MVWKLGGWSFFFYRYFMVNDCVRVRFIVVDESDNVFVFKGFFCLVGEKR